MQSEVRLVVAAGPSDTATVHESLVVSTDVYDADGEQEVASVTVRLPELEIEWVSSLDSMLYQESNGQHWYTTEHLRIPGMQRIVRGPLEVIASDLSGREAYTQLAVARNTPYFRLAQLPSITTDTIVIPVQVRRVALALQSEDGQSLTRELQFGGGFSAERSITRVPLNEIDGEGLPRGPSQSTQAWVIAQWNDTVWLERGPYELIYSDGLLRAVK